MSSVQISVRICPALSRERFNGHRLIGVVESGATPTRIYYVNPTFPKRGGEKITGSRPGQPGGESQQWAFDSSFWFGLMVPPT
jgi:hypothetical protein